MSEKVEESKVEALNTIKSAEDGNAAERQQADNKHLDAAAGVLESVGGRINITPEDDIRIRRKVDLHVLPMLLLIYILQQLDKSSLSYTSVFGIVEEANLVGTQYSWLSSCVYIAQLVLQPLSSYAIVRFPVAKWLTANCLLWGVAVAASAACTDFSGLLACRTLLGVFEATIAPSMLAITNMWWRRREQTFRVALWQASNGFVGIFGSVLGYGVGHIKSGSLTSFQSIFLFCGCLTIACAFLILYVLPDSPSKASFLKNGDDRAIAIERLRDNNMGTESKEWKWEQFWEALRDPKTYLWFCLLFLVALPSGGIGAFGPLIIEGFGFNTFDTLLFNMPFGAITIIAILAGSWITNRIYLRFPVIIGLTCFPIAGAVGLLKLGREPSDRDKLLACYYVLSFMGGLQPLLYAWASLNAAGHTKKVTTTAIYFIAQCTGNIVGPLIYKPEHAPHYTPGLISNLICWCLLAGMSGVTAAYLGYLNKQQAKKRVAKGKRADLVDTSILRTKDAALARQTNDEKAGELAFTDLTDWSNEDFFYVL